MDINNDNERTEPAQQGAGAFPKEPPSDPLQRAYWQVDLLRAQLDVEQEEKDELTAQLAEAKAEWERLREELNSVRICFAEASHSAGPSTVANDTLRARIAELEAELQRCPNPLRDFVPETYGEAVLKGWIKRDDCENYEWDNRTMTENARWIIERFLARIQHLETDAGRLAAVIANRWTFIINPGGGCYMMRGDAVVSTGANPTECIDAAMAVQPAEQPIDSGLIRCMECHKTINAHTPEELARCVREIEAWEGKAPNYQRSPAQPEQRQVEPGEVGA